MGDAVVTPKMVVGAWRMISDLYSRFDNWSLSKKKSKDAQIKVAAAKELMALINQELLSGKSSSDPSLALAIKGFKKLTAEVEVPGASHTEEWIEKAKKPARIMPAARKAKAASRPGAQSKKSKSPAGKKSQPRTAKKTKRASRTKSRRG